jgi:hypothetical protein
VFLTRRGRRVAAVIDAEQLDELVDAADDLADIRAAAARAEMAEAGEGPIPWELAGVGGGGPRQVKADLGLA